MYHLVYTLYNQCVKNRRMYLTTVVAWYTWQLETSVSNKKLLLNYNWARICLCSSACVLVCNNATSFTSCACAANNLIFYVSGHDSFIVSYQPQFFSTFPYSLWIAVHRGWGNVEGHNVIKYNNDSRYSCQNCSDTSVYFLDMTHLWSALNVLQR